MARFLADEPILKPKAANAEHGQSGSMGNGRMGRAVPAKTSALLPQAVEAAAVVLRGHMRNRNQNVVLFKNLSKSERARALKDMEEAIKVYLKVARKHAE